MKKLFTSVLLVLSALTMQAEDYPGNLHVSVPEMGNLEVDQTTKVTVNKQDNGKYELIITDFEFEGTPIGTIDVKDVSSKENGNAFFLTFDGKTIIQPNSNGGGDLQYQEVDLKLTANMTENELSAHIDINAMGGLDITVSFIPQDKITQIPNSNFEEFHTAEFQGNTTQEANHWHSFTSAYTTSSLYNTARRQKQSFESKEVRSGSTSKKSLLIKSALPFGIPANGTVTTGRIQAGSRTPTDAVNCAFLDLSNTAKDDNGDPFYVQLNSNPDAITFWTRFKQGQDNLSCKFASMRAVITDGTYYQDPEDKTYNNVVCVAANKTIEGTDEWQPITSDFDYEAYQENKATAKAILVTISTNAEPGVASSDSDNPDCIYIDDLSLIYRAALSSLKFKGEELFVANKKEYEVNATGTLSINDIEVASDGKAANIFVDLTDADGGSKATITIVSEDWRTLNTYVLNIKGATTGIDAVKNMSYKNGVQAIYNLAGQQVSSMTSGQVYIVKTTDGKTKKVIKK